MEAWRRVCARRQQQPSGAGLTNSERFDSLAKRETMDLGLQSETTCASGRLILLGTGSLLGLLETGAGELAGHLEGIMPERCRLRFARRGSLFPLRARFIKQRGAGCAGITSGLPARRGDSPLCGRLICFPPGKRLARSGTARYGSRFGAQRDGDKRRGQSSLSADTKWKSAGQ